MSTISPLLRMTLQALDENPDQWGDVLNDSALQLLEDSIAGTAALNVTAAQDYTLDDTAGGPTAVTGARYMILGITGSPGGNRNIIVPTRSKVYLVSNTSDGTATVKTVAGAGLTVIPSLEAQWVFCDGVDVQAASTATAVTAQTATLAANSTLFNGLDDTGFAKLAGVLPFTAGQVSTRVIEVIDTGNVNIDAALSNSFYHLTTGAFVLTPPSNGTNGQQFSLIIEQGVGAPHGITFASNTFLASGGAPTLSIAFGNIDYLGFEYVTGLDDIGGARWIVSIIKNVAVI